MMWSRRVAAPSRALISREDGDEGKKGTTAVSPDERTPPIATVAFLPAQMPTGREPRAAACHISAATRLVVCS